MDLVVASGDGNAIYYYKNLEVGSGTLAQSFQSAVTISSQPFGPRSVAVTDFKQNYVPTVIVASFYSVSLAWFVELSSASVQLCVTGLSVSLPNLPFG